MRIIVLYFLLWLERLLTKVIRPSLQKALICVYIYI